MSTSKKYLLKTKVKYFLRHAKIGRIYNQQNHCIRNVTESPSGRRKKHANWKYGSTHKNEEHQKWQLPGQTYDFFSYC